MCAQGGIMVLQLSGELDMAGKDELHAALDAAAEQSNEVDIDLSNVDYADSTALGLFVALRNKLRERGGKVRLVSPSPHMRKLLEYSGLDRAFEVT